MEKESLAFNTIIIVPCYNEAARFQPEVFFNYLNSNPKHAFCFVDDGSDDETPDLLKKVVAECNNAYFLGLPENKGKAAAVYHGMAYCLQLENAQYLGYVDADLATPLSFITILEKTLKENAEINLVFGSRQLASKSSVERKALRHWSGRFVASLISWAIKKRYGDTQCGAKLLRFKEAKRVFTEPFKSTWIFDAELIKRCGANVTVKEIPVNQWKDVGNSKVSNWYLFKLLPEIWAIRKARFK